MAWRSRSFECPECAQVFEVLLARDEPPPDFCPHCGAYVGPEQTPLPSLFNIGTSKGKSVDQVYRAMESASAQRAQEAASALGVPVSEVSNIKITDLKDNMREGDTAAVIPKGNAPSGNLGFVQGAQFAAATAAGPEARSGTKVRDNLASGHRERAAALTNAGRMGNYSQK